MAQCIVKLGFQVTHADSRPYNLKPRAVRLSCMACCKAIISFPKSHVLHVMARYTADSGLNVTETDCQPFYFQDRDDEAL